MLLHFTLLVVLGLEDWRVRLTFGVLLLATMLYRAECQPPGQLKTVVKKRHAQIQLASITTPESIYVYDNSDKYHSNMGCTHVQNAIWQIMRHGGKKTAGVSRRVPCGTCMQNFRYEKEREDTCQIVEIIN